LFESSLQAELAGKLSRLSGLDYSFFCNSGTEAVEAAIKFARKYGDGKFHIITALNSFHGRTYGSLSATGQLKLQEGFAPLLPGFSYVPYNDIREIEKTFNENTIAVLMEPIQGEGGINIPDENYLKQIRDFCDSKNILMILDEVQCGLGRTGKFFAYQHSGIMPDIVTIAKGLANGIPIGAVICSKQIGDLIKPGNHGSTFGGNPIAVSAAIKVVDLIDEKLLKEIDRLGGILLNSLYSLNLSTIKEIRGKGLMIGIEFNEGYSAKKIAAKLIEHGVVVGTSGDTVLRVLPPFIISEKEIMKFLSRFRKVAESLPEINNNNRVF
ncbi:MAG TPA: aminotransferase class III-fold pyridoxal phosphate-dependent enzyme, partial [Ignavibacteriaceae bacterium]|nr:aminotransferase class III-fold pyridoxal phosphate-dependent enzyme [Ignavibacteriaceae bacterium]